MHFSGWNLLFSLVFLLLFAALAVLAAVTRQSRLWWLLAAPAALLAAVAVLLEGWARLVCIDLAALLSVFLVWEAGTPAAARAGRTYLWVLVASAACLAAGVALGGEQPQPPAGVLARLVPALLLAGFALKLALAPVFFWLPGVAAAARPLSVALVVSLVDIAAFVELVSFREAAPWVFSAHSGFWLALALLSMLAGALLALAQRDLKRMLAYSTIDDMGYLLLGLLASTSGLEGARLGALSHAVMKVLLFGALAVAEYRLARPVTLSDRGLAARFPVAAAAFIVGALGMIGVPPTLGFLGRWRLYLSGVGEGGPWLLFAMLAATALALLYYVRAIHTVWLGQPRDEAVRAEPLPARIALAVLAALVVAAGLYPGLWVALLP